MYFLNLGMKGLNDGRFRCRVDSYLLLGKVDFVLPFFLLVKSLLCEFRDLKSKTKACFNPLRHRVENTRRQCGYFIPEKRTSRVGLNT